MFKKRLLFIIFFNLMIFQLFSNTADEFYLSINNIEVRLSWHFNRKFDELYDRNTYYRVLLLFYNNYQEIKNKKIFIWLDCFYSENYYNINFLNKDYRLIETKDVKNLYNVIDELIKSIIINCEIKKIKDVHEIKIFKLRIPEKDFKLKNNNETDENNNLIYMHIGPSQWMGGWYSEESNYNDYLFLNKDDMYKFLNNFETKNYLIEEIKINSTNLDLIF